jgi:uncharacterized membrane protein (Fun14 family)
MTSVPDTDDPAGLAVRQLRVGQGGILCLVYGYAGYWSALPMPMRFVSVLAGLLMLLLIGISYLGVS